MSPEGWPCCSARGLRPDSGHPCSAPVNARHTSVMSTTAGWAEFLVAQAEVHRLAGALDQAEASLRRALQFYEDRRIVPLAAQARTLLASLTMQRHAPAQGQ